MHGIKGFVAIAALTMACMAGAHTVWLVPTATAGDYRVMFGGHEGKVEGYAPAKLKEVIAYSATGKMLPVTRRIDSPESVIVHVAGTAAMITVHFDNGIYSTTPEGRSVNTPMDQTPGATKAVNAIKYHKTIVTWGPRIVRPVGQKMEVVPLSPTMPRAGQPMQVKVLLDGKPASGIRLGAGEDKGGEATNAMGIASFTPTAGFNKLWAGKRTPITGNPHYTELSYEYLLGFNAK